MWIAGSKSREIFDEEQQHLAPGAQSFALFSQICIDHGEGALLFDVDGNRFIDLMAGIGVASLGYAHPKYVAAMQKQVAKIHVGSFTSENRAVLVQDARGPRAGRHQPHAALLERRRGGGVGAATREVVHGAQRGNRLLGRLPRQDGGRASAARLELQVRSRTARARTLSLAVRSRAPLRLRQARTASATATRSASSSARSSTRRRTTSRRSSSSRFRERPATSCRAAAS